MHHAVAYAKQLPLPVDPMITVAAVIAAGQDVNAACDSEGMTPLMYASLHGHADTARVLIDKGARLEAVDKDGRTPLLWASLKNKVEVVRVLIEKGACLEAADKHGMTSLMHASKEGHAEVVTVIKEHMTQAQKNQEPV